MSGPSPFWPVIGPSISLTSKMGICRTRIEALKAAVLIAPMVPLKSGASGTMTSVNSCTAVYL